MSADARLRVRGLGRLRPRGRREPRLAPARRLRGRAAGCRDGPVPAAEQWSTQRRYPSGAGPLPCTVGPHERRRRDDRRQPSASRARPGPCRAAPSRTTGSSWRSSARSAGSGYVVNLGVFALCVEVLGIHHLAGRHLRLPGRRAEQLLVEPATGRSPAPAGAAPASRPPASSRSAWSPSCSRSRSSSCS